MYALYLSFLTGTDILTGFNLRPGELLRYERSGDGGSSKKVLVVTGRKIYVKTETGGYTMDLAGEHLRSFRRFVSSSTQKSLRESPKSNPAWPSASGGYDQAIAIRKGGTILRWNNRDFEYPAGPTIFTFVDAILEFS